MRSSLLLAAVLFVGCGTGTGADETSQNGEAAFEPSMENGVQTIEIEAGSRGFAPARVALEAGKPVRMVFHRTTDAECLHHVTIPAFGIEKTPIPLQEKVAVEFTPEEGGEYTFVCGMGMQKGTIMVTT